MTAAQLVGRYVAIDPFDAERDPPLLWEALGGEAQINERLRWFGWEPMRRLADFRVHLDGMAVNDGEAINVFRDLRGAVLGMASYLSTVAEHGVTEVGYVAHGPAMSRTPASTEAHYLLAQRAFDTFGYRRYEWKCNAGNLPSRRAAERMGFVYEGTFRQQRVARDRNRDTAWFSMTDGEWPACRDAFEAWLSPDNFDPRGCQKRRLEDLRRA
ncbi:MAG: GNAT family protein [Planctomycetota bacterium]